jgi:hypothetical protein
MFSVDDPGHDALIDIVEAQQRFLWERIEEQLGRLHKRITPEDRKRIEATLIEKIGKPPTKAQRAELDRKWRELVGE